MQFYSYLRFFFQIFNLFGLGIRFFLEVLEQFFVLIIFVKQVNGSDFELVICMWFLKVIIFLDYFDEVDRKQVGLSIFQRMIYIFLSMYEFLKNKQQNFSRKGCIEFVKIKLLVNLVDLEEE